MGYGARESKSAKRTSRTGGNHNPASVVAGQKASKSTIKRNSER